MNIENNFKIPDPGTFWSLQTIDHLGEFSISTEKISEVSDTYLDTRKRRLLAKGYSCCKRDSGKKVTIILTKLDIENDASNQLKEWGIRLKKNKLDPVDWPESKARTKMLKILPNKKLQPIFIFKKTRITRSIYKGDLVIAHANLDDVSLTVNHKERQFKTLKIKMINPKHKKHLNTLITAFQENWHLEPETLTKFERALAIERRKPNKG